MTELKNVEIERGGPIATVTLNRPEKANALNYAHLADLESAALSFADDAETRVVIFTGAGRHFCSGADLTDPREEYRGSYLQRRNAQRIGQRAILALYKMSQITIAAWEGGAMGGGACVATALDFRAGSEGCFIQYPEVEIGVNLNWKGLPLITRLVGPARAKRLVVGGERMHAETLRDWGVLDRVVPSEELMSAAREMADFYARRPPIAAQMIKESINALSMGADEAIMHMDFDQNLLSGGTEDATEAARSYLAKTEPHFKGN